MIEVENLAKHFGAVRAVVVVGSSVVYAALCVALAVYQFRQERVLFRT